MIKFTLSIIVLAVVWIVTLNCIPTSWHLLIGWVTCSVYYGAFDLQELIENYNENKVK